MQTLEKAARGPTYLIVQKNPVKLTALLYFREALIKEQYEQLAELAQIAREFGAEELEIQELLEDVRRMPR